MSCPVCEAQIEKSFIYCHECPDMTEPDGTVNIMPGCMGGSVGGSCTCSVAPLHACGHCRHTRPVLVSLRSPALPGSLSADAGAEGDV